MREKTLGKCQQCSKEFLAYYHSGFYAYCAECRKAMNKKKLIEKWGSLENYYKQRTELGMKKKIEKYGSIENAYKASTAKGQETKSKWTKDDWDAINSKINETKSKRTLEQKEASRMRRHKTIVEKYGSEANFAKENIRKGKENRGEDYRKDVGLHVSQSLKNRTEEEKQKTREKTRQTIESRYGSEELFNKYLKERRTETNLVRFGCENTFQSEEVKNKSKATKAKRYGDENYNNRDKFRETCFERYGTKGIVHKAPKYMLNGEGFDSSWEVAYYIWLVDQKKSFVFHPKNGIYYTDSNGKEHWYYPDFLVDGRYVEIKGDHLYRNGFLTSPSGKLIYYAKTKCYKDNGVQILTYDSIKPIIDYVIDRYGKNYISSFRVE